MEKEMDLDKEINESDEYKKIMDIKR